MSPNDHHRLKKKLFHTPSLLLVPAFIAIPA
jgi:hypothetical protein